VIRFGVQQKTVSKLSEADVRLTEPLRVIASRMAAQIRERVKERGQRPDGRSWSQIGTWRLSPRANDPHARWWVPPGNEQPPGYFQLVSGGEFDGWAVYENYTAYLEALPPSSRKRKWDKTGEMWRSLGVRMLRPGRAKVTFFGRRPTSPRSRVKLANAQVAYLAGRYEGINVLQFSREEAADALDTVKAFVESAFALDVRQAATEKRRGAWRQSNLSMARLPSAILDGGGR